MNEKFFDAHTHAHFAAFKDDYREVVRRSLDAGVGMINAGTQKDTSAKAVAVAHEFESEPVYAAVGLHPIHTSESFHDAEELGADPSVSPEFTSRSEEFDYECYKKLALDPKTVAIGECGLDYAAFVREQRERLQKRASAEALREGGLTDDEIETQKRKQVAAFEAQIKLAHEVGKPLMIHCRNAFSDLIKILDANCSLLNTRNPGVIHFFSGTKEDAKKLLDLGFTFTFGGVITFTRDYDEIVEYLPFDRILSETDAPYVAPVPHRGKRNEPAYVIEVVKRLAEIRGVSLERMAGEILKNATRVFKLN